MNITKVLSDLKNIYEIKQNSSTDINDNFVFENLISILNTDVKDNYTELGISEFYHYQIKNLEKNIENIEHEININKQNEIYLKQYKSFLEENNKNRQIPIDKEFSIKLDSMISESQNSIKDLNLELNKLNTRLQECKTLLPVLEEYPG